MPLLCLPNELLLLTASNLTPKPLASLTLTNRRLATLLTPLLTRFALLDYRALHQSVQQGRADLVRRLLDLGVPINITNNDNETALHKAVSRGNVAIVQLLIERGAALEIETTSYKETPLLRAAADRSEKMVRLLVEGGANVNAENLDGRSVLLVVYAWWGYGRDLSWEERVGEFLVRHGAERRRRRR